MASGKKTYPSGSRSSKPAEPAKPAKPAPKKKEPGYGLGNAIDKIRQRKKMLDDL